MATPFGPKQIVSFEELLMSQVIQHEALTRLLVEKGVFTEDELIEMVKVVDRERKKGRTLKHGYPISKRPLSSQFCLE